MVFVGSDDTSSPLGVTEGHKIYALDASTGATIWTYTTGGSVYSSPAVTSGVVYVGSNDGKVYAIGTILNTLPSPASPVSLPSVPEFPSWITLLALTIVMTMAAFAIRKKSIPNV